MKKTKKSTKLSTKHGVDRYHSRIQNIGDGSLTLHIKSYCIINWDNVIFFDFFLFFSCVPLRVVLIYLHKHSKENFL